MVVLPTRQRELIDVIRERGDHRLRFALIERDLFRRLFELTQEGFAAGEVRVGKIP